jgi:hypothetical protein
MRKIHAPDGPPAIHSARNSATSGALRQPSGATRALAASQVRQASGSPQDRQPLTVLS